MHYLFAGSVKWAFVTRAHAAEILLYVFKKMMLLLTAGINSQIIISRIPQSVCRRKRNCVSEKPQAWKWGSAAQGLRGRAERGCAPGVRGWPARRDAVRRMRASPLGHVSAVGEPQGHRGMPASLFLWACSCFWSGRQKPSRRELLLIFRHQIPYSWIRTCRFGYHFHR